MTRDLPGNEVYWVVLALDSKYRTKPACFRLHADLRMGSEAEHDILMTVAAAPSPVVKGAALLGQVVQDLIQEVCKPCQLGHDQMVRSLAQRLVIELARRIRTGEQLSSKPTSIDRVRRFLAGLSDECDSQWSLEEMASSCGMGRTQFASLVKDLTGDNPVQHLNRLRIQNAERLLAASDQSIIDIAFACGFATSQYFATVFKAFAGMDPTTWRRHNRADVHTHDPSTLPG